MICDRASQIQAQGAVPNHESRVTFLYGFIHPVPALALEFACAAEHLGHITGQRPGPLSRTRHEVETTAGPQLLPYLPDQTAQCRYTRADGRGGYGSIEEPTGHPAAS